jgi:hypothetical protein
VEWRSNADSSGLCEFEDLPTDVPLQVEILRDGRIVERDVPQIALAPGEARDVEWKLSAGCRLKGFVVDQHDEVVAGRELWLQRADHDGRTFFEDYAEDVAHKAVTDKDGRFAFDSVNQGKWWVGPSAEPDASGASDPTAIAPVAEIVEIRDGTVEHEVRLRVHRGLYIRGQVLDPKGEPAAKVYIHASTDVAAWLVTSRTDKAGAFALGPLVPGRYSLVAKGWTHADSKPVVANAGDSGVDLHLEAGGSLIGAVVDGSTGKASAAMLTFSRRGDIERGIEMSDSGDDGTFRLEGLASGLYDVVAVSSGQRVGVLRELTVQGGVESSGLVVTLAPGALLRVKYAGTDESMGCRVSEGDTTIAGGGMLFGGSQELVVPAGHLMLECGSTSGWSETRTIDLTVGQVLEVAVGGK